MKSTRLVTLAVLLTPVLMVSLLSNVAAPWRTLSAHAATQTTATFQITTSSDDVNQDGTTLAATAPTLWLGTATTSSASYTALRFASVTLPRGATIVSAHLEVFCLQSQWISINMSLAAEAAATSAPFSATNKPSQRLLTAHSVNHTSNTQWQANTWYALNEMAVVVQDVVAGPSWQSGNSLSVLMRGSGASWARKFIQSFDGSVAAAPKLVVTYTTSEAATAVPTPTQTASQLPTPTNTATSTPTHTATSTPTSTATLIPTSTSTAIALPTPTLAIPTATSTQQTNTTSEWTQDAHDAQRTGSTTEEPSEPWTLAWTWNGPDASGGTGNHFYDAPKEARTVTGAQNVYVPAGLKGIFALAQIDGRQVWNVTATAFNATPAYDSLTGALFAGGADGQLYKINASSGQVLQTFNAGSPIQKSILVAGSAAYFVTANGQLYKVNTASMTQNWVYSAASPAATPPSYSSSRTVIIYATADLFVHAVNTGDGTQKWRVKPSPNPAGFPNAFDRGWPVIAERHGIVFLRMQLNHSFMSDFPSTSGIYPNSNAAVRSYLQSHVDHQNLFALSLDDGSIKFIPAVGYGSTEDFINGSAYGVMGAQPVVKVWPDGTEVAYIHFRTGQANPLDYRWDGNMGEMVLDNATVPNLVAGDLRFVRMARRNGYGGTGYVDIVDEQSPITIAGNTIFHAHWGASESVKITDRSTGKGLSYSSPIETTKHPSVIRQQANCANKNIVTHWTTCGLTMYQDGRYWDGPGFWVYWNVVAPPGSPQANAYSAGSLPRYTYVSNGLVIIEGNGGELFVLRHAVP